MRRRDFLTLVGAGVVLPAAVCAQQTATAYRIGYLSNSGPTSAFPEALRQGLREFGWVDGENIVIDYRFAEGRPDRLPDLAAELVHAKVDIIVASPTPAAVAARNATATIPIVIISVGDPVGLGLIASLARPGGNVTGLSYSVGMELFSKQLEMVRELIPDVSRVAILSNPANLSHALAIREGEIAAQSLGLRLQLLEARGPDEFDAVFAAMVKERAGALLVVSDSIFVLNRTQLADLAAKNHLPSMYGIRDHVEAGGLMFYGPSLPDQFRRAATYVDKILKGARPTELPVEQPTKFELVINLKTANLLGISIPPALLLRADDVIE
jgi:putative ABC transport system substrate-binding protein